MGRLIRVVAIVGFVVVATAGPAQAGPVRSGAVAGGPIDTGPGSSCENAPECLVWLASGCDPHLAGLDPAAQTSIVDVADLAGRRTERLFVVIAGTGDVPAGVVIGGFRVQLWSSGCKEIHPSPHDSFRTYFPSYIRTQSRFKIPARAAWMTATADDNVLIRWELH